MLKYRYMKQVMKSIERKNGVDMMRLMYCGKVRQRNCQLS